MSKPKMKTTKVSQERYVTFFQLCQWRGAVRLESKGMKHSSGRSVTAMVKRELGIKGTHEAIIEHLTCLIEQCKKNKY
jgi:hypothetical protein